MLVTVDLGRFLREKNEQGLPLDTTQAKEDDLRIDLAKGGLFITPGKLSPHVS
jgi:hypothetical protein